jgi:hypothetical protein
MLVILLAVATAMVVSPLKKERFYGTRDYSEHASHEVACVRMTDEEIKMYVQQCGRSADDEAYVSAYKVDA